MGINLDKPELWESDIIKSIDSYNSWFMSFAPQTFRDTRISTSEKVEIALAHTKYLTKISPSILKKHPDILPILRMCTCPPIARDRLIGLAGVKKTLVENMEDSDAPMVSRISQTKLNKELRQISDIITKMLDKEIFPWVSEDRPPQKTEALRASTIIADRLCRTIYDPIIRNAQEKRQLDLIVSFLQSKGYSLGREGTHYNQMAAGTFLVHTNVPAYLSMEHHDSMVNISVDVAIMPRISQEGSMPLFIEAKSAGDLTNVNKRRKEEAQKIHQLKDTYGDDKVSYSLFLSGYFNKDYLKYEAAEGIDWIWEHQISDLEKLGI